jgi:TolA-binding protein
MRNGIKTPYFGLLTEEEIRSRIARLEREADADGVARGRYQKARQHEAAERYPESRKLYGEIASAYPKSAYAAPAAVGLGRVYFYEWNLDESEKTLEAFIRADPRGPHRAEANILLGDVHLLGRFRLKKAVDAYERAADYETSLHVSWKEFRSVAEERLGTALLLGGDFDKALKHYENSRNLIVLNKEQDTLKDLGMQVLIGFCQDEWFPTPKFLLKEGSERARTALVLGDAWYEKCDFDRARKTFGLVVDKKQLGAEATPDQRLYAEMQLGVILDNTFKAEEAIALYRRLIRDNPTSRLLDSVLFKLGCVTFNQTKRKREAVDVMLTLSRQLPNSKRAPEALYAAGFMLSAFASLNEVRALEREMKLRYPDSKWLVYLKDCADEMESKQGKP